MIISTYPVPVLEIPTGCWSKADSFEGGPGTFCWFFFNFMFMIWDSRHEDLQLFWPRFKVASSKTAQYMYKHVKVLSIGSMNTPFKLGQYHACRCPDWHSQRHTIKIHDIDYKIGRLLYLQGEFLLPVPHKHHWIIIIDYKNTFV